MKCSKCGRQIADDAKFCDMCGTPVSAKKSQAIKSKPEVDPHYDLSVFSDDSSASPEPQRPAPAREDPVGDDAAKTELLIENNDDIVGDDAAKTVVLPENEIQPQRNRYEENIAMNRRYRKNETRPRYPENDPNAPRRNSDYPAEAFQDEYRAYPPAAQHDYRDNYHDNYRADDPRGDYQGSYHDNYRESDRYAVGSFDNSRRDDHRGSRKKNPQKKALIISLIALILVIAILIGVIFFVKRDNVSAAELQEAKDNYLPPSQAVQIDTSSDDPSNDDIQFKYDDRARIISCFYSVKDKPYEQHYTYRDPERQLEIETTYKNKPIDNKIISYDQVATANDFEDVDGYIVRLDEESLTAGETLPPTIPPTAEPTAAPTEARTIVDAQSDEAMEKFLSNFISWYTDNTPYEKNEYQNDKNSYYSNHHEYDCQHAADGSSNILTNVCDQLSCVDWSVYSDSALNRNNTAIPRENCPWWGSSSYDLDKTAMGVETFDRYTADWICKNIFNITDDEIETLYNSGYSDQKLWRESTDAGDCYCILTFGKGGPGYQVQINSVKTDGKYYYVTYGNSNGYNNAETLSSFYTILELKNIDGQEYWSMHYHTSQIPEEITPYDPQGR